jgi:subtilisin family serine protease
MHARPELAPETSREEPMPPTHRIAAVFTAILLGAAALPAGAAPAVAQSVTQEDSRPAAGLLDLPSQALSSLPSNLLPLGILAEPDAAPVLEEEETAPAGAGDAPVPPENEPAPAETLNDPAPAEIPVEEPAEAPVEAPLESPAPPAGNVPAGPSEGPAQPKVKIEASAEAEKRYLVRYTSGTDVAAEARSLRSKGLAVGRTFTKAVDAAVVSTTATRAAALERSGRVEAVEPDGPVRISDTQQQAPWGLDRIDQAALPLSSTFSYDTKGAGVSAYVVDTGVRRTHAEFGGRVTAGWSAVADGLGSGDCNGHGTHVAGSVAAATYGVAKAAQIVPVRVLNCDGAGRMSDVVAGLDWIAGHHQAGAPAVANLSLGGGANSTVDAAVQGVINDGVTVVAAAGNSSVDACGASPARVPAALTVAASDSSDKQASFSNYGSCVDLYGPGVSIRAPWYTGDTAVATLSGTSMAAPHVAGAAALLLSKDQSLTPAQVASTINGDAVTGKIIGASSGTPNRLLHAPASSAGLPGTGSIGDEPTITSHNPAASASNAAPKANVTATFSADVLGVSAMTFALKDRAGTPVPATVAYDSTTRTATLDPAADLTPGVGYSATLTGGPSAIRSTDGTALRSFSWSFTTAKAPGVKKRAPKANAKSVERTGDLTATFSKPVRGVSASTVVLSNSAGSKVPAQVSYNSGTRTATLDPSSSLAADRAFTLTLVGGPSAIRDRYGTVLDTVEWSFTTGPAPKVKSRAPAPASSGIKRGSNIAAVFTEPVRSVSGSTFLLKDSATGTRIAAKVYRKGTTNKWILNPESALAANTRYTVVVKGGPANIRDRAGNPLRTARWTFTTGP